MKLIKVKPLVDDKIIIETLERIGIANKKEKILYPTCYFYYIDDEPYILHFKQLFILTREDSYNNISEEDIKRLNSIVFCLHNWGLIEIEEELEEPDKFVFVLPYKYKSEWIIKHKFNLKWEVL